MGRCSRRELLGMAAGAAAAWSWPCNAFASRGHGMPMLPLGVMDAQFRSFEKRVLPELNRRRIGSIAMKTLGGFMGEMLSTTGLQAADCLRYAMSLPVSTVVVGMESMDLLRKNLSTAHRFRSMDSYERAELLARAAPFARDGRFERYKTTLDFEAPPGRKAHGFK